jgi:acetylornithine/N-succinyldiaminopimelate aminotransferase
MSNKIFELESRYIMPTYSRPKMILHRGRGMYVFDTRGNKYLDFIGGIATCAIGHSNRGIRDVINRQANRLLNVTNLYYTEPQVILAKKLVKLSGLEAKVFFPNSGTESVEAAIKLARKYTGKTQIIAARHSFHGRTLGSLSATWKPAFRRPFAPLVPGFKHIVYNNPDALKKAITRKTAAFIVEPIQGEEGVITPKEGYLQEISIICKNAGILLIIDEIQTGMGRTGTFFTYQAENVKPDIVTLAKGLANGIPIGATIAKNRIANVFVKGDHGSTFGGNSFATAAANATIDYILKNRLIENVKEVGGYFIGELNKLKNRYTFIKDIRGKGLMVGVELSINGIKIVERCLRRGLLINCCGDKTLRFLPPLIVTMNDVNKCINILNHIFAELP